MDGSLLTLMLRACVASDQYFLLPVSCPSTIAEVFLFLSQQLWPCEKTICSEETEQGMTLGYAGAGARSFSSWDFWMLRWQLPCSLLLEYHSNQSSTVTSAVSYMLIFLVESQCLFFATSGYLTVFLVVDMDLFQWCECEFVHILIYLCSAFQFGICLFVPSRSCFSGA